MLFADVARTERKLPGYSPAERLAQTHGQRRRPFRARPGWLSALRFFLSDTRATLRIIRGEVRSCRGRIGVLLGKKEESRDGCLGLDLGPMYEAASDGCLQLCKDSFDRNEGIARTCARYPWASAGDALLFLEGWEMAMQCHSGSADTSRRERVES
jgi:hypothetical protein